MHPRARVVLITGASVGVGLSLARRLIDTGYRLVLTARRSSFDRFAAAGIHETERVHLLTLDVTLDEERRSVIAEIERRFGGVDVLVNNAGVAFRAVVEDVREAERLEQMRVNFNAPMALTRLVLPRMRERRRGHIINVSSVGGMMAMPTMAIYSASKFALEGMTEALWYEVRPWGIRVTLIEPGFINSAGFEKARDTPFSAASIEQEAAAYHQHYDHMNRFIARLMRRARANPDLVARRIHAVMESRRTPLRVQATTDARFFSLLRRLLPQRLYHGVLYRCLPGVGQWGTVPATTAAGSTAAGEQPAKFEGHGGA